jgi:uncharacterized protein YdeI (YjbR/CyaY-like superfamily)
LTNSIEQFFIDGCMRCAYGATPQCKVNTWREVLTALQILVLEIKELKEEMKWGVPCYTYQGKNILTISAYKDFACLSFFKGSLLSDPNELLILPGERSQAARYIKCTEVAEVGDKSEAIRELIFQAIEFEKKGYKVMFSKEAEPLPEELKTIFEEDSLFKEAFYSLSPGRQRGYIIYFTQPKHSKTRHNRIINCKNNIFNGIGMHDKYKK